MGLGEGIPPSPVLGGAARSGAQRSSSAARRLGAKPPGGGGPGEETQSLCTTFQAATSRRVVSGHMGNTSASWFIQNRDNGLGSFMECAEPLWTQV